MLVLDELTRRREHRVQVTAPARSVRAGPIAMGNSPVQHPLDAAAQTRSSLGLSMPDGLKDAQHVRQLHVAVGSLPSHVPLEAKTHRHTHQFSWS